MAIFPGEPELAGFIGAKDDGSDGSWSYRSCKAKKAKQGCVMGVGMCLYAQLVQTKNT